LSPPRLRLGGVGDLLVVVECDAVGIALSLGSRSPVRFERVAWFKGNSVAVIENLYANLRSHVYLDVLYLVAEVGDLRDGERPHRQG